MVKKARRDDMDFFKSMNAYTRCPRQCVKDGGGKLVVMKWLDVSKGDSKNPVYRSRLVGKGYTTEVDTALCSGTPPLEALMYLVSLAATDDGDGCSRRSLMVTDVFRTYVNASATRDMFIELPREDPEYDPTCLEKLNVCLYGTRDAALNWQRTPSEH